MPQLMQVLVNPTTTALNLISQSYSSLTCVVMFHTSVSGHSMVIELTSL